MQRGLPIMATLLVALILASCGSSGGATGRSRTAPLTKAERLYGLAPDPHPNVTYQSDVVVVGGGAGSVRSAAADGLTWTLDPNASHVGDLAPGKVMVLTNQSTGRVISLDHTSAGVVVTLAPVPLGEVFKDATFSWHVPISSDQIGFDVAPEPGGNISAPAPGSTGLSGVSAGDSATSSAVVGTPVRLTAARVEAGGKAPARKKPPARPAPSSSTSSSTAPSTSTTAPPSGGGAEKSGGAAAGNGGGLSGGLFGEAFGSYAGATGFAQNKNCGAPRGPATRSKITSTTPFEATPGWTLSPGYEVTAGNWAFESERSPGQLTFRVAYVKGVRIGLAFRIHGTVSFSGTETIKNGKESARGLRLDGIDGFTVAFVGGSASAADNIRARIDIPINFEILTQQLFIEGIPFVVAAKPKVIIETAFSANYSTLWTCGDYKLNLNQRAADGPTVSFFKAAKSLLPIGGISIGVNAVVVAAELKFHLGMGLKTAYAGPFVTFGAAVGATRGSDIGIVNCQSADLVVTGKAGVGLSIDSNIGKFLNSSLTSFLGSPRAKNAGGYRKLLGLSQKLGKDNALDFDTALYAKNLYGPVHKTIPSNVPLCTG